MKTIGSVPVQLPVTAVSTAPSVTVPEIVGRTLTGGSAVTRSVAGEAAGALPTSLVAVTTTRTVWSTSSPVSVYVGSAAPSTSTQSVPSSSQSCHW